MFVFSEFCLQMCSNWFLNVVLVDLSSGSKRSDQNPSVKWWMETNKKGNRSLIVDGFKFNRYGSGTRKFYHWYCRYYQSLGLDSPFFFHNFVDFTDKALLNRYLQFSGVGPNVCWIMMKPTCESLTVTTIMVLIPIRDIVTNHQNLKLNETKSLKIHCDWL